MENIVINDFLIEALTKQYGQALALEIVEGYKCKRYTTIRMNTLKTTVLDVINEFNKLGIEYEQNNLFTHALIIKNKTSKEMLELDLCKEGKIYLQSLSSQLPAILLEPTESCDILDMCASPGSKTTYLAQLVNNNSFITACDQERCWGSRCDRRHPYSRLRWQKGSARLRCGSTLRRISPTYHR